jgi:hypothetical protein
MTRFSFERAMGVLLLALTVILSLMMIHSPGTGDVPLFLNWTEVVYQNGLVGGYSKVVSENLMTTPYPPLSFAILSRIPRMRRRFSSTFSAILV